MFPFIHTTIEKNSLVFGSTQVGMHEEIRCNSKVGSTYICKYFVFIPGLYLEIDVSLILFVGSISKIIFFLSVSD